MTLVTRILGVEADAIAPDGSEVRLLATAGTGAADAAAGLDAILRGDG